MLQAQALAADAQVAMDLPPEVELSARNLWRAASLGTPMSLSHARVVNRLRALGLRPQVRAHPLPCSVSTASFEAVRVHADRQVPEWAFLGVLDTLE